MDIEGAELDALNGAKATIRKHLPKLAVCLYHVQEHLWEIPLKINDSILPIGCSSAAIAMSLAMWSAMRCHEPLRQL